MDANVTTYQDTNGLNPSTSYSYHVRAFNQFGVSEWCNEKSATTLAYAGSGTPYLASLSVMPGGIKEGETTTGTVTLSAPAPAGGTTVILASNNSSAVALPSPAQVIVPAGAISASFSVTAITNGTGGAEVDVTLSASSGDWLQGAFLDVMPAATPLAVDGLTGREGNACAVVNWNPMPGHLIRGYHVYRSQTATGPFVEVTSAAIDSSAYADVGLTNGTTYYYKYYKVTAEDGSTNIYFSPTVAATPSSSVPQLAWYGTPSVNARGEATVAVSGDMQNGVGYTLLVDGHVVGTLGQGSFSSPAPTAVIDTTQWENGVHTLQVIALADKADGTAAPSGPYQFTVQADVDGPVWADRPGDASVSGSLPCQRY